MFVSSCVSSQGNSSAQGHDHDSNRQQQLRALLRTVLSLRLQTQVKTTREKAGEEAREAGGATARVADLQRLQDCKSGKRL